MDNNSLKDYYIQLHKLSSNTLKLMNAISESFKSYSPEVIIQLDDSDEQIKIPSFLYLENKIEELENTINYLFKLPEDGEAWFSKDSDMYKLNIIQSNLLPPTPSVQIQSNNCDISINTLFKDLIFPKTSLKIDLSNISSNIHDLYVKKIVIYNESLAEDIFNDSTLITYDDYNEKLYLMNKDVDYNEYDINLSLPINNIHYNSHLNILNINSVLTDSNTNKLIYQIRLNTLYYYDSNDSSITYKLKNGDYLSLSKYYNIFKVNNINEYINYDNGNNTEYIVELIETNGHTTLDTIDNNENMYFVLYTDNNKLVNNYVNIPLDHNKYSVIFISSVYNNVKSLWSNGIKINLDNIYVTDNFGKQISYLEYFDKYCVDYGNIFTSFANNLYIQPNSFTNTQLKELTTGKTIQDLVTQTLYTKDEPVVSITILNDHLVDDELSSNLARLHKQKLEINNTLNNINNNIDETYNQLINTDFSQNTSVTQTYLKSKLDSYYNERLSNQQQLISIINNIDLIKNDVIGIDELKYRIRGITNVNNDNSENESDILTYLHYTYGNKCDIIGLEVEYKYQNVHSNSTTIKNNSNSVFTDWVRINNIDKQRYLKFDSTTNEYTVEYVNYDNNLNIIKWNQIDIPIQSGEDVVIRIRYKYNIGQPFINLYTPWSDDITVSYSDENTGNVIDIVQILRSNENDINKSSFINELINGGYQEHITNKIIDNSQVYYHLPENIYSGFNTAENKFISLKDKLIDIDKNINEYKEYINNELSSEYKVFLQDDKEQLIELTKNTINTINLQADDNYDSFIRKDFNLIIKNTGNVPINFYSIFPGNTDIPLIHSDINHYIYNRNIEDYERVPLLIDNVPDVKESIFPQVLGQWIYFRNNNIYTKEYLYHNSQFQNNLDINKFNSGEVLSFNYEVCSDFISGNNNQMLLGFRNREITEGSLSWHYLELSDNTNNSNNTTDNIMKFYDENNISKFIYNNSILKYEHIQYIPKDDTSVTKYFDNNTSITYELSDGLSNIIDYDTKYHFKSISDLYGLILIPNLLNKSQIVCDNDKNNQYKKLGVGKSISIPILCEYFINNQENTNLYKTIAFSLHTSLTKDIDNYIFKVVLSNKIKYNTTSNETYIPLISSDIFN